LKEGKVGRKLDGSAFKACVSRIAAFGADDFSGAAKGIPDNRAPLCPVEMITGC
jgi:hypothetical protein